MKNKYFRIFVPVLIVVEFCSIFLAIRSFNNRDINKDNVYKKNKMFAMYVKDLGETEYSEWEEDTWPSGDFFAINREMTECSDVYGNALTIGVDIRLEYGNTGRVTVTSNKTVYCNMYFDFHITAAQLEYDNTVVNKTTCEDAQCAIDELYSNLEYGKSTESVAGLYRYQGPEVDNYICFGTTNKNTCTGDTDKYMYRIIGIVASNQTDGLKEGQIKLIKKEALNTAYAWHSVGTTNTTWPNSDLYNGLNGSYFLDDTDYVPSGWKNRIADTNWHYGNFTNTNATIQEMATTELGFPTTSAKIGLMYLHDYAYAMPGGNHCTASGICETSWINICRRENDRSGCGQEWSMTRYNKFLSFNQVWIIYPYNLVFARETANIATYIRPVFYLTENEEITSGSGTIDDPFILS